MEDRVEFLEKNRKKLLAHKKSVFLIVTIFIYLLLISFPVVTSSNAFFFSQRDERWSIDPLGNCQFNIGQEGCAITCIAMIMKYYGLSINPRDLNTCLRAHGGYSYSYDKFGRKHALVRWEVAANQCSNGKVQWIAKHDWKLVPANLSLIDSELDKGHPVIVETRWGHNEKWQHFVVLTHRRGSTYSMYDPMDRITTGVTFNERYGSPSRWIYGARIYHGPSLPTPVLSQPGLSIDGKLSSQKQQLETFHFTGSGYAPGAAIQHIRFPDGSEKQYSATIPSNGKISWDFTPQCTSPTGRYTIWVTDANKRDSNYVYETITRNPSCSQIPTPFPQPSPLPTLPPTATVLVMDVSGSMGSRWKGGVKIESAKKAALEFIEEVTHEAQTRGGQHKIGVVAFSGNARVLLPLTSDYNRARQVIISLSASNATNLGAGLVVGLGELNETPSTTQRFIILLSDGETNTGLSRDQILNGPVADACQKKICIHTVAFGDPGDIDETFLRKVGFGSRCGSYSYAATPFELFATYIKLRDRSFGQIVGEYSSIGHRVTILPGMPISLGTVIIGSGKRELHYTLAWSEQGRLQIRLKDPSGMLVTSSYPGAYIYTADQFTHLTLLSPKSGIWTVEAAADTSMPNGTEYYAILSTRPGGIAIPLPLPTFTIGNRTFGLPSGLPPWLLVTISVALIALVLYSEFGSK